MGKIVVRLLIPGHSFIEVKVDVVKPNIPMLIGLDALDANGMYVNNIQNLLVHNDTKWGIPLVRKAGHVYCEWDNQILFTINELRKMHVGFYHPSTCKIFNLISRAHPLAATAN